MVVMLCYACGTQWSVALKTIPTQYGAHHGCECSWELVLLTVFLDPLLHWHVSSRFLPNH